MLIMIKILLMLDSSSLREIELIDIVNTTAKSFGNISLSINKMGIAKRVLFVKSKVMYKLL